MKLIILGPQASGKGTQSTLLAKEFGLSHISTGERLRNEIASGSQLGKNIKKHMDKGELVPDKLTMTLVTRALKEAKGDFILDGFPRDKAQTSFLDKITNIDQVILLKVSDNTAIRRVKGRLECPKGHEFHIFYQPPKQTNVCDEDGLPLRPRSDDTTEAIAKRLHLYHAVTEPILKHYKDKIVEIDGEQSIKDVHFAILKAIRHHH